MSAVSCCCFMQTSDSPSSSHTAPIQLKFVVAVVVWHRVSCSCCCFILFGPQERSQHTPGKDASRIYPMILISIVYTIVWAKNSAHQRSSCWCFVSFPVFFLHAEVYTKCNPTSAQLLLFHIDWLTGIETSSMCMRQKSIHMPVICHAVLFFSTSEYNLLLAEIYKNCPQILTQQGS
jgi:hypothetical protein